MREGMTFYLGKHFEYKAESINVAYGLNVVAMSDLIPVDCY